MPNLIKQYFGEIRPAPELPPEPRGSSREAHAPDTVSGFGGASDVSMEPTDERHAMLDRAFVQSQEILEAAREKSNADYRKLMDDARAEGQRMFEDARSEGFDKGYAEGSEQGKTEGWQEGFAEGMQAAGEANEQVLQELKTLLETAQNQREDALRTNASDLTALSIAIAKKILHRELETRPDSLRTVILDALEAYRNQAWIRVNVSPALAQVLLHTNGGIAQALQEVSENVKVVPTPDLTDTDCVIELPDLAIDAGIQSQMRRVEEALGANS